MTRPNKLSSIIFQKFSYLIVGILILPLSVFSQKKESALIQNLVEFSKTSAVTGREIDAASFIKSFLPNVQIHEDRLGNIFIEIGKGEPKKLITAPLDEPGYVINGIQEDGYLKIAPIGYGHDGTLFHQFIQGHEVVIQTANGPVIGVSTVPSLHFEGLRAVSVSSKEPANWQEVFIDIGVSTKAEVEMRGIRLLDPVTQNKKITVIADTFIAAPSMRSKAAAIALATVANTITKGDIKGTLVIAFSTLELLNGKGLEAIINSHGPFKEIHRFNRFLTSDQVGDNRLLTNDLAFGNPENFTAVHPTTPFASRASTIDVKSEKIYEIGLPCHYANTPVEMVAIADVENLIQHWLSVAGIDRKPKELPIQKNSILDNASYGSFSNAHNLLAELIGRYGVSTDEGNVRNLILEKLPKWAKPEVDSKGNVILNFGQGENHIVFVAHMDETGYMVDSIQDDGKLTLKSRGGMFPWIWEAQPALVHSSTRDIAGVFEPRSDYLTAKNRTLQNPLTINAGFSSKTEAVEAGIKTGQTTVTMPKKMIRLSENRATARGFDDRVGCAALLLILNDLDPALVKNRITFVWSVEEEGGLTGSTFAAKNLTDATIVYPIDTYVSSDDPYTSETFANSPLGNGAVIRVLESINFVSRKNLKMMQDIAAKNEIKVQYGMTAGGTDGQAFLGYGIPSIPLSWPGRYSHSPIEVMDYRDMHNLELLISAIIKETE